MSTSSSSTPSFKGFQARPASAKKVTVRCAIIAAPGAGKTYGGLLMARGLVGPAGDKRKPNGRACIAVIDTQNDQSDNYSETIGFPYDVIPFEQPHSPERAKEALLYAAELKYDVVIFDSLSHEWAGEGGVMEQVDESSEKNKYFAWRGPSKAHNAMFGAIVGSPIDIICTVRTKIAYEIQDQAGKKVPKRIGLAPIQRPGSEYEFDLVLGVDQQTHEADIQKCNAGYHGVVLEALAKNPQISKDLGASIAAWRAGLVVKEATTAPIAPPSSATSPTTTAPAAPAAPAAGPAAPSAPAPAAAPADKPKRSRAKPQKPAETPPAATTQPDSQLLAADFSKTKDQRPAGNGGAAPSTQPSAPAAGSPGTPSGASPAGDPSYTMDDSVFDVAEVPTALATEVRAVPRDQQVPNKLWKAFHEWLLAGLSGDVEAAMRCWQAVKVVKGSGAPTSAQVQELVFNVASVRITNPAATAAK